jgi:hypothetical protein
VAIIPGGSGVQSAILLDVSAESLPSFRDEQFANFNDLERGVTFGNGGPSFRGGYDEVSAAALMFGLLSDGVLAGVEELGTAVDTTAPKVSKEKATFIDELPPIDVFAQGWTTDTFAFARMFFGLGFAGGDLTDVISLALQAMDDFDLDGVPNENDEDMYDPNNTNIVVTAPTVTTNYGSGFTSVSNGTGTLILYENGDFRGYFVLTSFTPSTSGGNSGSTNVGVTGTASITGPSISGTAGRTYTVTNSNGSSATYTRVPRPSWGF